MNDRVDNIKPGWYSMSWLYKLISIVMQLMKITCRDTSTVISEMIDHPVSFIKYSRIKIHLAMCGVCRYYKTQLEILIRLTDELSSENSPARLDFALSPESKPQIKKTHKSKSH